MNRDEAKVRVRIDTSQAKHDLADLVKAGQGAAGAIGGGGGRGAGSLLASAVRAVGLGAAFGAGFEAIRGPLQQGSATVLSEAFGGIGADFEKWVLGDMAPLARASSQAREQTVSAWGAIAGMQGKIPPEARNFYAQALAFNSPAEKGRQMFETDDAFRSVGFGAIADRLGTMLSEIINGALENFGSKIRSMLPFGLGGG